MTEYMGYTYEDAFYLYNEEKGVRRCDWLEYMLRDVHRNETHLLIFFQKAKRG